MQERNDPTIFCALICSPLLVSSVMGSLSGWMWTAARVSRSTTVTSAAWPLTSESGTMPEYRPTPCPPANQPGPSPPDSALAGTVSVHITAPFVPQSEHFFWLSLFSITLNPSSSPRFQLQNCFSAFSKETVLPWKPSCLILSKKNNATRNKSPPSSSVSWLSIDDHLCSQNQSTWTEAERHRTRHWGPREISQAARQEAAEQSDPQDLPQTPRWKGGTTMYWSFYMWTRTFTITLMFNLITQSELGL